MKKLIYNILIFVIASVGMTSCLHDNNEVFDKSAAQRIEEAVKTDRQILESAPNGWQMTLWTGADYSGGGYSLFLTFKDGKVTVQSDMAPSTMKVRSDYDIVKDQGPVLTFNTYNTILHYMAEPSSSALNGNEGDFEFIIQRATNDSIFLKGKKWGNKTVLTRVADGTDVAKTIEKMQNNLKCISGYYSDGKDIVVVDPSTRRVHLNYSEFGVPYNTTEDGIKLLYSVDVNGKGVDTFVYNAQNNVLQIDGKTFERKTISGYNNIEDWVGEWKLRYVDLNAYNYAYFDLGFEPVEDLIGQTAQGALNGYFYIDDYKFELIVYYSPLSGGISIPPQYIADPTGTYGLFLLLGTDVYQESLSWYAVDWYSDWDAEMGQYKLIGDCSQTDGQEMNTMQMLVVDSNGNLVGNSEGQAMALVSLPFVDYLLKK